jgi:hypothetical protein
MAERSTTKPVIDALWDLRQAINQGRKVVQSEHKTLTHIDTLMKDLHAPVRPNVRKP